MGAWGPGIFDEDFASDIQADFQESLEAGFDVAEATKRILEEYADVVEEDEDEGPTVYLALASLQMEHNALQPEIRDKALEIITQGKGMDRWEEVEGEELDARRAALQELKEQILTYKSSEK